ncbi:hypothetical protein CA13_68970 [Planctomycetes bacterium CA13]|uniref:Uncharacterized protein n=1 Tax=Novipirellula herctigrandis TaxID=2527986 RepID=A0A5C5YND6_9BACT|nr:hypothetical protein CA13_68970 [Planctomycetes bacterium CA13]
MSTRRHLIAVFTFAAIQLVAVDVSACCLKDWLFGRTPAYVVGYGPAYAQPYAASYTPVATIPYSAGSYSAGYRSALPLVSAQPYTSQYQVSGVYQAQRPTYYDNPSVYTGLPVVPRTTRQTSYSLPLTGAAAPLATPYSANYPTNAVPPNTVPLAQAYRGAAPTTSFYGGSNAYPPVSYNTPYSASYGSAPVVTGAPVTAMPATQMAPLYPAAAPATGTGCGLSRFCAPMFGTNYQTSYYRAPVTYYRPVTTVDPVSGTTVTTQQGCSSYETQLQRTPYASLGATPPTTPLPSVYGVSPATSQPYAYGGVNRASGIQSPTERSVVPIPATGYGTGSSYEAPNTAPLTGPANGDLAPLSQPQLGATQSSQYAPSPYGTASPNSGPSDMSRYLDSNSTSSQAAPSQTPSSQTPSSQTPSSQTRPSLTPPSLSPRPSWQLQNPSDSNVFGSSTSAADQMISATNSQGSPSQPYSDVRPIEAPPGYTSPFERKSLEFTPSNDYDRSPLSAPPLPASNAHNRDYQASAPSEAVAPRVPVREAALIQQRSYRQPVSTSVPVSKPRDSSGWYSLGK